MPAELTIYQSDPDAALEALARLDSSRCPRGRMLVAAVAGEPRAAVPLDGGPAIADPFQRTAELVSLLELRATQLNQPACRGRRTPWTTLFPRGRQRPAGLNPATDALR